MTPLLTALKATLFGGILFLLPVGIVVVVLGKLVTMAAKAGRTVHDRLLPGLDADATALAVAVLFLLLVALVAGLFARTQAGQKTFVLLESLLLTRLPFYSVFRHALGDFASGAQSLTGTEDTKVVLVRLDDMQVVGFVIDTREDGSSIVYLPGAPSALSGSVALVTADRITETAIRPTEVIAGMRRLGKGLIELNRRSLRKDR
jgi:uncharacterized membrane protein